jgi:hypothetical protein
MHHHHQALTPSGCVVPSCRALHIAATKQHAGLISSLRQAPAGTIKTRADVMARLVASSSSPQDVTDAVVDAVAAMVVDDKEGLFTDAVLQPLFLLLSYLVSAVHATGLCGT